MSRILWTRLAAGDGRVFLFSPRFNRTYLISEELASSTASAAVFGLDADACLNMLDDPATSVELVGAFEKPSLPLPGESIPDVGIWLPRLYKFFHSHRSIASIKRVVSVAKMLARCEMGRTSRTVREIGEIVRAVEIKTGISDCYPRALLTACLCLSSGLNCSIAVGILAPTANIHAWCTTRGVIPFEPVFHHWWYAPLVLFEISR